MRIVQSKQHLLHEPQVSTPTPADLQSCTPYVSYTPPTSRWKTRVWFFHRRRLKLVEHRRALSSRRTRQLHRSRRCGVSVAWSAPSCIRQIILSKPTNQPTNFLCSPSFRATERFLTKSQPLDRCAMPCVGLRGLVLSCLAAALSRFRPARKSEFE
jgi:hypothetical protein